MNQKPPTIKELIKFYESQKKELDLKIKTETNFGIKICLMNEKIECVLLIIELKKLNRG